jgi:hypothetical protein
LELVSFYKSGWCNEVGPKMQVGGWKMVLAACLDDLSVLSAFHRGLLACFRLRRS